MRIFVTGASGWIGSAVVTELLGSGHEVLGLARSDGSAQKVAALGADVHRGDLNDLDSLRSGAAAAEGVVHLGYHHDFSQMAEAAAIDRAAIDVLGATLEDTGGPLVIASGTFGLAPGRVGTERDRPDPQAHPRVASAAAALAWADRGVRSAVVRFPPTVHGPGDHGFIAFLVDIAGNQGVAAYVGDGANRWPAVHRLDAAELVRRTVQDAPAGSVWHAVAEEGIATRDIADAIGRALGVPTASVPPEEAVAHFGWIGPLFAADAAAASDLTRELLSWEPTHPGLVADLDAGCYTG